MIEFDLSDVSRVIDELSPDNLARMQRKSLRSGAKVLYDSTKKSLKAKLPAATRRNPKFFDTLEDAVRMNVGYDSTDGEYYFTVHILGTRTKGSGTYRARFFETGTVERRTAKGYNRGRIEPINFFGSAINADGNKSLQVVNDVMVKEIERAIENGK